MKILHLVPSYKPAYIYGGPVESIARLCEALAESGDAVTVFTTTANGTKELEVKPGKPYDIDGVKVHYFKRETKDPLHLSVSLLRNLYKHCQEYDVVHIHSWWNIPALAGVFICKRKKAKTILSPRGMFSEYILQHSNSSIKKWAHKLLGKNLLKYTLLHATSASELNECQAVIKGWRGMVIPNILHLPQMAVHKKENKVFTILFLSRIHPKKGLELLFEVMGSIEQPVYLRIAGSGEQDYITELKTLARQLSIADKIEWLGWKDRAEKFDTLMRADLFVLPSYNENFGNVVIEALHVGTPVLVTKGVALSSFVQEYDLGWVCGETIASVKANLINAIHNKEKRDVITAKAPSVIKNNFSPEALVPQYHKLYTL